MKCRECRERMQRYLAQALPGKWAEAFEQHIAQCAHCTRELEENRQIIALLQRAPAPTPPPDLSARIKAAAGPVFRQPQPAARRAPAAYLKVAAACAAVLVIAVAAFVLLRGNFPRHGVVQPAVTPVAAVSSEQPIEPAELVSRAHPAVAARPALVEAVASPVGPVRRRHRRPVVSRGVDHVSAVTSPGVPPPTPVPAESSGLRPQVVSAVDKAPSLRAVRTAEECNARVPVTLASAALRTGPSAPVSVATAYEEAPEAAIAQTLVGTVVANAVVNRYFQEAVIESDATLVALTTSAPASMIEVVAKESETN